MQVPAVPAIQSSLLQAAEQLGTRFCYGRVGRVAAGQCRPATLRDKGALFPRTDLLEFSQVCCGVHRMLKFVDTDGSQCRHNGGPSTLTCHFPRGFFQCPPTEAEAKDHGCYNSDDGSVHM